MTAPVVTLSASYGTGGPLVGRAIAESLDVPFLDRAIPTAVAQKLAVTLDEAEAHDERAETRVGRMLAALAASGIGFGPTPEPGVPAEAYRGETERVIVEAASTTGCVVLGRAATIVLRDHPTALHAWLTGSLERRLRQAIALNPQASDEATTRKLLEQTDGNRKAYFRHFYGADADDPSLYHVMLDTTVLDLGACAEFITTAARLRSGR